MSATTDIAICWPTTAPPDIPEVQFSYDFCQRTSRNFCNRLRDLSFSWINYNTDMTLAEVLKQVPARRLLVVTDPELLLPAEAVAKLAATKTNQASIWGPVFNQTPFSRQIATLPASYLNVTGFVEITRLLARQSDKTILGAEDIDPACFLVSPAAVSRIDSQICFLDSVSMLTRELELTRGIVNGALVHRFGDYYGGERADLVNLVPETARHILDVGCARGGYGKLLKKTRPEIYIAGIEMNPTLAIEAKTHYDKVYISPVEQVDFSENFDLVNCGDVLEHLPDPLKVLRHLRSCLKPGGRLIASVPNIGHWSVVKDLLQGTFEYIPVGLLCTSHIRWFTENSLHDMLANAGFSILEIQRETIAPTPEGEAFIRKMRELVLGDELSLRTNELVVQAIRPKQ